ncbi:hypothetical protein [Soonwooa sp.]|uniref:hypothetical protein n=1 Tax=Soonwooa sp. TaxID=1938592 RepID=UPI00260AA72E|nr:hypothetical protein [Soonwooa sp.]
MIIYIVVGIFAVGLFIYSLSNPNYIYYSLGIWLLYVVIRYAVKKNLSDVTTSLMALLCSFFLVSFVFSVSPALKIEEFKLMHPTWKVKNIDSYSLVAYYARNSKGGFPTTDIEYSYSFGNDKYEDKTKYAIKYIQYFFQFKSNKELVAASKVITEKTMHAGKYVLFVNQKNPKESRLFLLTSWFNFRYSLFAQALFSLIIIMSITIFCVVSYSSFKAGMSPLKFLKNNPQFFKIKRKR